MNNKIQLAINALKTIKGDDFYRAKIAFRGLTEKQLNEMHGDSGKTKKQLLYEYMESDRKIDEAIDFLKNEYPG